MFIYRKTSYRVAWYITDYPVVHPSDRITGPLQNVTWYLSVISINIPPPPQWDFNEFRIIAHGTLSQWPRGFLLAIHGTGI